MRCCDSLSGVVTWPLALPVPVCGLVVFGGGLESDGVLDVIHRRRQAQRIPPTPTTYTPHHKSPPTTPTSSNPRRHCISPCGPAVVKPQHLYISHNCRRDAVNGPLPCRALLESFPHVLGHGGEALLLHPIQGTPQGRHQRRLHKHYGRIQRTLLQRRGPPQTDEESVEGQGPLLHSVHSTSGLDYWPFQATAFPSRSSLEISPHSPVLSLSLCECLVCGGTW